ncbi:sulfate ABC transporter substrate-binding protein [Pantanalinema rosaneae CENA516]|uniref:sulfate ABC transporter substrate-binding protein n=1 Tax=Pantanalinema rosaneae TaxID=1620701 RepID=UPI003D6EEDB8
MVIWGRMASQWQKWVSTIAGWLQYQTIRRFVALFLVSLGLSVSLVSCIPGAANSTHVELTLVSFAVTRSAYKTIIPKFAEQWQQAHGQTVNISQSYGGSGAQARAVIDGLDADVVHLALALDVDRIAKAGLIDPGWEQETPNQGIVSKSVAALVTRPNNPKDIHNWADLAKTGVRLVTADPKTSGVARWNFLALWNAAIKTGQSEAEAEQFVTQVYHNAPVLTRDAREATDAFFKQGQGDALINYENEILLASIHGETLPYTIPDVNISIDNPIAIVDQNVKAHRNREVVEAFVQYLFTPEAQAEFAKAGFRPVDTTIAKTKEFSAKYPPVPTLGQVADYGGWSVIQKKFFADGAMFDMIRNRLSQ